VEFEMNLGWMEWMSDESGVGGPLSTFLKEYMTF